LYRIGHPVEGAKSMMHDGLREHCEQAFVDFVDELFRKYRIETYSRGSDWIEEPVIGLFYRTGDEAAATTLKKLARRAYAARGWFVTHGPAWAQPLPLSWGDIGRAVKGDGRAQLVGNYSASLLADKWDFERHPPFHEFCCGMLAQRSDLCSDPELRREFPPKRLKGLMSSEEAAILDHVEYRLKEKDSRTGV
jgi:hypothetical protein